MMMPTVLRIGSLRFFFYSDERNEPAHMHVATPDGECKFWLEPVALAHQINMPPRIVRRIERHIEKHREYLIEEYNEFRFRHDDS